MWQIGMVIMGVFLVVCSVYDLHMHGIPNVVMYGGSSFVIIHRCLMNMPCLLWMGGMAVGVLFLFVSKGTKEALGYGDSWMILLLGLYLGIWDLILLLSIAFFLCSFRAMYGLLRRNGSKEKPFAFIPFLTIAYVSVVLL